MEALTWSVTQAEREFYGEHLVLLEGAISEFLSCMDMIRRYRVSLGKDDPVACVQARIKGADSMRQKLKRQGLPVTVDSALHKVWDAAGVRLICPFVSEIYTTASLIRGIPGIRVLREKDYVRFPKPNGYRSYHMIVEVPVFF